MTDQVIKSDYEVGLAIGASSGMVFAVILSMLNVEFHFWPDSKIPYFIVMVAMIHILGFFVGTFYALKWRVNNKQSSTEVNSG